MKQRSTPVRLLLTLVWRARRLLSWPPAPIHTLLMAVVVLVHSFISSRETSLSASERAWLEYERSGSAAFAPCRLCPSHFALAVLSFSLTGTPLVRCSHRRTAGTASRALRCSCTRTLSSSKPSHDAVLSIATHILTVLSHSLWFHTHCALTITVPSLRPCHSI